MKQSDECSGESSKVALVQDLEQSSTGRTSELNSSTATAGVRACSRASEGLTLATDGCEQSAGHSPVMLFHHYKQIKPTLRKLRGLIHAAFSYPSIIV